ncbi:hypothetical protein [Pseudoalteromonas shioyasakiensis]|uniref:hypothetical protein n=1 Tax=Pseudoalteromonas shioyasakiensis TaxID=1190813 RepID=UPI002551D4E2|nr:hypothetical protein [Pseudoalteromonas shioyasakiensis]MDK9684899.1 hypothetical protein [Pseudoalteromonas shioyasakiensis]
MPDLRTTQFGSKLKADGSLNFTPTSTVGVTLAWRVLYTTPFHQPMLDQQTTQFGSKLTAES